MGWLYEACVAIRHPLLPGTSVLVRYEGPFCPSAEQPMKRHDDSRRFANARRLGIAMVLLVAAQVAPAVCVQTSQQLTDALSNPDYFVPLTIQLVQGTYSISGSGPLPANTAFLGGYTQNCASRQIASGNTVLTASASQFLSFQPFGNLSLEGLPFELP